MEYPKPTKLLRTAYRLPIHLALRPGGGVLARPKESPFNLVDVLEDFWWGGKGRYMIYGLRGKHRFDQSGTASRRDMPSTPCGKLAGKLILKVLKVNPR
jgi:hypothetical protein